ncbi:drug resistance transporter, EmrB/QacA subfamily [Pseudomonas knackmussii B13]|uniref:Drug resistance transporter, EmrB/QacA subfamily n=1 Tax=Pseudomonas knackmussii (strain DSM 6978 / CCUG 54928 / LMG 23759 / B13) TaxID=1301098 RepID=A0A024HF68_PSEKB|nr:DHA2 family efflux MFS transporter permease subunit [Pseudomonas knackmussii]CDF83690.1 drug resistance transporter, EmrB/QacA subfamily [Pseudomonas knackmussii B13]
MNATAIAHPTEEGARALRYAALLATYLQSVNLPLPNAALRFIQGSLSMADDQVGWIFTAYFAASAITLPIASWLAARFGLRRVYLLALAVFALGLVLATLSTTPLAFSGARIIQGAASGVLGPLSMAIALETLPAARRAKFGVVLTAIVLSGIATGPSIGGWVSDLFGWRWMFYLGLPVTAYIVLVMGLSLAEKKAAQRPPFDFFGYGSFTLGVIGLQLLLDRGERLDWFASTEICVEALASALGFYLFAVHRLTTKTHFLGKHLFRDRNFVLSTVIFFALGFVLLPTLALTSPMLDEILGYPPITTGCLTLPRGAGLVGAFLLAARMPERIDPRLVVAAGVALVAYANWLMLGYSPLMDWRPVAVAGALQGIGLGVLMPSISKVAFSTLDPQFRPEATGLFNLARIYGSTLGIAIVQTYFFNNMQAMHMALGGNLTPFHGAGAALAASSASPALLGLNEMLTGQAAFVSVLGQFKVLMLAMLAVAPLVPFLRKPNPAS